MTTTTRLPRAEGADPAARQPGEPSGPSSSRRRTTILVALAAATAIVLLVWVIAFSPVLGVKTVTVRGAHTVTITQVRERAGVRHGTPLVRLDPASIVRRIEALPVVASASVHISYPNTVVITVVERVALGYLESGSQFTLVDRTGNQFRTVSSRPRALPLFAIPAGPDATATGEAVASVAGSLPAALLAKIASIQAFDPTEITLLLTDRRVVSWGSADRNAEKASILPTLLTQPGTQFNVSDPGQVFAH